MRCILSYTAIVIFAVSPMARGDSKADIKALRAQIKVLQQEEKTSVATIKARYKTLISGEQLDKSKVNATLQAVEKEKNSLLALATTKSEKAEIRAHYKPIESALRGGRALDNQTIAQLRKQESGHVALVRSLYKAKIKQLQDAIKQLQGKGKKPSSRVKH